MLNNGSEWSMMVNTCHTCSGFFGWRWWPYVAIRPWPVQAQSSWHDDRLADPERGRAGPLESSLAATRPRYLPRTLENNMLVLLHFFTTWLHHISQYITWQEKSRWSSTSPFRSFRAAHFTHTDLGPLLVTVESRSRNPSILGPVGLILLSGVRHSERLISD